MPTLNSSKLHIPYQQFIHKQQPSSHLPFTFPQNHNLDQQSFHQIKPLQFHLPIIHLYPIQPHHIHQPINSQIHLTILNHQTLQHYIPIYPTFPQPYPLPYPQQTIHIIPNQFPQQNKFTILP
ncbi:DUF5613 domain-containing protein, partial [Staphylococcus saprophyticus]|uniref:DUF5613 domain-containing protein n=1 Tax=Staphylococcus saprophyticus TaxID=29385 RepID=UPI003704BF1C